jgi:signal transduction histidine kinase
MRFFHSLYFRLLRVYGLTFLLLVAALIVGFRYSRAMDGPKFFQSNVETYAGYLSADIGVPPRLERATELSRLTGLDIVIRGPGVEWGSSDRAIQEERSARVSDLMDASASRGAVHKFWHKGPHGGWHHSRGGYEFTFMGSGMHESSGVGWMLPLCIAAFALILSLSYRLTRRIFRPIDEMKAAAIAFGEGKWDTRVGVGRHSDELAELAETMNAMAGKIRLQLKSMRELLIAISHELRSPLTRMKVSLEFLSDPKLRSSLTEEIDLLDHMTEALLERERISGRPEHLKISPVDLVELLREVSKPYADRGPGVRLELPDGALTVSVDRARFAMAVRNLIDNAIRHAPSARTPVRVSLTREGMEISDSGPGMPPEVLARLGEPFLRVDPARTGASSLGGFGMGLSLAYTVFQAHGFKIRAASRLGDGTRFVISFG